MLSEKIITESWNMAWKKPSTLLVFILTVAFSSFFFFFQLCYYLPFVIHQIQIQTGQVSKCH